MGVGVGGPHARGGGHAGESSPRKTDSEKVAKETRAPLVRKKRARPPPSTRTRPPHMEPSSGPPPEGSLLAVIGDEVGGGRVRERLVFAPKCLPMHVTSHSPLHQDTVTGFLLAGVGHVDLRRNSNFLIVNDSESREVDV